MTQPLEDNPYAVPQTVDTTVRETPLDRFIYTAATPLLKGDESIRFTVTLMRSLSLRTLIGLSIAMALMVAVASYAMGDALLEWHVWVMGAVSGLLGSLIVLAGTKPYLAAVTAQRMILMRTRLGAWGLRGLNLGVEEVAWEGVEKVSVGGIVGARLLRFRMRDGSERVLTISPGWRAVSGQRGFFEWVQGVGAAR